LIDAGINIIETDAVYFFKLKQMHFIKRVQLAANGVTTIMHPNDIFDSFVVTPDMDFQVLGKVLKIWRSESYV
jgi:phage repressor protein C with HTH and peptisase S24 domain